LHCGIGAHGRSATIWRANGSGGDFRAPDRGRRADNLGDIHQPVTGFLKPRRKNIALAPPGGAGAAPSEGQNPT